MRGFPEPAGFSRALILPTLSQQLANGGGEGACLHDLHIRLSTGPYDERNIVNYVFYYLKKGKRNDETVAKTMKWMEHF